LIQGFIPNRRDHLSDADSVNAGVTYQLEDTNFISSRVAQSLSLIANVCQLQKLY
jgi:hypothetical protein